MTEPAEPCELTRPTMQRRCSVPEIMQGGGMATSSSDFARGALGFGSHGSRASLTPRWEYVLGEIDAEGYDGHVTSPSESDERYSPHLGAGCRLPLAGRLGVVKSVSFVGSREKMMKIKRIIREIPVVGPVLRGIYRGLINPPEPFQGSDFYWKKRYDVGGNSGDGSYSQLAEFKAEILNAFVSENDLVSVIEYGCGDGNQLGLASYPKYLGFDISSRAVSACRKKFSTDKAKNFKLMGDYCGERAELTLSLDVIYHLVEDFVFVEYMHRLFDSSERFVVIYSSDTDVNPEGTASHVRHRSFSNWIEKTRRSGVFSGIFPTGIHSTAIPGSGHLRIFISIRRPDGRCQRAPNSVLDQFNFRSPPSICPEQPRTPARPAASPPTAAPRPAG